MNDKIDITLLPATTENTEAKFKPFKGTTTALSLAKCEPFTDLKVWQLEGNVL